VISRVLAYLLVVVLAVVPCAGANASLGLSPLAGAALDVPAVGHGKHDHGLHKHGKHDHGAHIHDEHGTSELINAQGDRTKLPEPVDCVVSCDPIASIVPAFDNLTKSIQVTLAFEPVIYYPNDQIANLAIQRRCDLSAWRVSACIVASALTVLDESLRLRL